MLKGFRSAALGAVLILTPALYAQDNSWVISPQDSAANFSVKHMLITTDMAAWAG